MNGSSRSLIKALRVLTDDWKEHDQDKINSDSTELFKIISSFCEKHNDLQSIRQTIDVNDELFRIYNNCIKPFSNLPREVSFLEILTQLLPILVDDGILLWLKTYLRPAVDSAGFDVLIVLKSREFIRQLSMQRVFSDDPLLTERRNIIASTVMDYIIQLYICKKDESVEIIGLHIPKEGSDDQPYYERIRYMKQNCEDLLHAYGLERTNEYFDLINRYLKSSSERLEMLTLLSRLASSHMLQICQIVNTDLFHNLLRSLLYDLDESIIVVSLSIMVILIPQISDKIASCLPDLLVVYIRLSNWELFNRNMPSNSSYFTKLLDENQKPWNVAKSEILPDSALPNPKIELDVLHFITLLYGLFPLNLSKFCKSPYEFLANLPTGIFKIELLSSLMGGKHNENEQGKLETLTIDITTGFLRSFTLHPNFFRSEKLTLQEELDNPLLWFFEEVNDNNVNAEEISLACLSFNPFLVTRVYENLDECMLSSLDKVSLDESNHLNEKSQFGFIYRGTGDSNICSLSNSRHVSRKSSFTTPLYFSLKDGLSQKLHLSNSLQLLNNKFLNHPIRNGDTSISEIKFKDIKFDEGLIKKSDNEVCESITNNEIEYNKSFQGDLVLNELEKKESFKSNQLLNDLFSAHEKLYGVSSKTSDSKSDSNAFAGEHSKSLASLQSDKNKVDSLSQGHFVSQSTSLETTPVNIGSICGTSSNMPTSSFPQQDNTTHNKMKLGTALDYYNRELLLMKNELEFSNYMKDLNKAQYIKIKFKLAELTRKVNLDNQSIEYRNSIMKMDSLKLGYNSVVESLEDLRCQLEECKTKSKTENLVLFDKIKDFENENNELKVKLKLTNGDHQQMKTSLKHALEDLLPEKEFEINRLRKEISELKQTNEHLKRDIKEAEELNSQRDTTDNKEIQSHSDFNLSEHEKSIYNLKMEIQILNEKNSKMAQEIVKIEELYDVTVKSYESKLSSSKLDLNKNLNSFTSQYEKKFQELSSIILKYEGLLEEKNKALVQLSSSKPIKISKTFNGINPTTDQKSYGMGNLLIGRDLSGDTVQDSYEHESRGRTTPSSAEGIYSPHFELVPLHLNHVSNSHVQPSAVTPPIIKGRGGIQKRSKKHM